MAVTAGLALFLVAADPEGGKDDASGFAWIVSFAVIGVAAAALTLAARGRAPARRAALLGIAGGIMFGLAAALTKATVERLDDGILDLLGDWHFYALVVVGYVGLTLSQSSFQTGALAPAVATQMASTRSQRCAASLPSTGPSTRARAALILARPPSRW